MASSPSFSRTLRSTSILQHTSKQCSVRLSRPFTTTLPQRKDIGPGRDHVLDKAPAKKDEQTNIQSEQSKKGRDSRAQGGADTTTAQKDTSKQTEKIKKEHPEAPDAIGFQDERGGKVA